jgi:N-formylglutamate amidohydrolase
LAIYGKENQFVHAIALNIFQGNKLSHQMHPQHVRGLRQAELEDYIQQLIAHLEVEFGILRSCT